MKKVFLLIPIVLFFSTSNCAINIDSILGRYDIGGQCNSGFVHGVCDTAYFMNFQTYFECPQPGKSGEIKQIEEEKYSISFLADHEYGPTTEFYAEFGQEDISQNGSGFIIQIPSNNQQIMTIQSCQQLPKWPSYICSSDKQLAVSRDYRDNKGWNRACTFSMTKLDQLEI